MGLKPSKSPVPCCKSTALVYAMSKPRYFSYLFDTTPLPEEIIIDEKRVLKNEYHKMLNGQEYPEFTRLLNSLQKGFTLTEDQVASIKVLATDTNELVSATARNILAGIAKGSIRTAPY